MVNPMDGDSKGVYSIGAVVRMLGIPAQTLRAWEDRYGHIVPARSAGGQRLYSRDQIDQLRFVREQVDSGLQPADAHRLLAERRSTPTGVLGIERPAAHRSGSAMTPDIDEAAFVILIAERDPYAADFADYFLRTEGYLVRIMLDVPDVERMLKQDPPDLVVIDLMMAGGAGLGLCRTARKYTSIPILAVSVLDSGDTALESGADAFLQKPLEPLQFVSTVRDLLGTSAFLRQRSQRK